MFSLPKWRLAREISIGSGGPQGGAPTDSQGSEIGWASAPHCFTIAIHLERFVEGGSWPRPITAPYLNARLTTFGKSFAISITIQFGSGVQARAGSRVENPATRSVPSEACFTKDGASASGYWRNPMSSEPDLRILRGANAADGGVSGNVAGHTRHPRQPGFCRMVGRF